MGQHLFFRRSGQFNADCTQGRHDVHRADTTASKRLEQQLSVQANLMEKKSVKEVSETCSNKLDSNDIFSANSEQAICIQMIVKREEGS